MPQLGRLLRVSLMALGSFLATWAIATAQTAPAPSVQPAAQPPQPQSPGPESGNAAPSDTAESFPVFAVSSIEILHSAHTTGLDVIAVRGLTSSDGWENATLVPLTSGLPKDGVLDLVLVADAPQQTEAPGDYAPIQAVLPVPDFPFKAVRVRAATNTVTLTDLNGGYAETKPPINPCGPCVGKLFVATGATAPAGVAASDIVRQADLPPNTRVLRPTDGITDMRTNPNRLTIVVDEDGSVVDAIWE